MGDASLFYPPDNDDADKNGAPRELEVSIKLTLIESLVTERDGKPALWVTYRIGEDVPNGKNPRLNLLLLCNDETADPVASRVLQDAPAMLMNGIRTIDPYAVG